MPMRSETEVQDRIRHLLTLELDRLVAKATARLPHQCIHNHRQPLDVRKEIEGEANPDYNRIERRLPVIGLCMLGAEDPTQWNGTICEDPIDAQRCPYYTDPKSNREVVEGTFHAQLQDLRWVEANMPEVYGLLWALGSETMPQLPWWKTIWFRLLRIRPDALVKVPAPELPAE